MTEDGEKLPVDKYEYFRTLPLEAVTERLHELGEIFGGVQRHYTGPIGRFRRKIRDDDMTRLEECIGDLLPMGYNNALQRELLEETGLPYAEHLTFHRVGSLQWDILLYGAF